MCSSHLISESRMASEGLSEQWFLQLLAASCIPGCYVGQPPCLPESPLSARFFLMAGTPCLRVWDSTQPQTLDSAFPRVALPRLVFPWDLVLSQVVFPQGEPSN
jgi:hypothetical protein